MVGIFLSRAVSRPVSTLVAAAAIGILCAGGCGGVGAEGTCPALDACGGDPTGTWKVVQACQYQAVKPTQPTDVNDYMGTPPVPPTLTPPQPQPTQLVPTSSGDWCSSLDYNNNTVNNVTLWHDAPGLQNGEIAFNPDHSYAAIYTFTTQGAGYRNMTHFAPICLTANGGSPTCADLTAGLTKFYGAGSGTPPPPATFNDIQCTTASDMGCDCTYYFALQVVDQGNWSTSGDTISQQSSTFTYNGSSGVLKLASPAPIVQTTFCRPASDPSTLYLTGANGGSISDLLGLRTLSLTAM
jgi:hypothetical protein